MRRQLTLLFALLLPFIVHADQPLLRQIQQSGNAAKVHPQLLQKLALIAPNENIAVWIQLRDRPQYDIRDLPALRFLPPVDERYVQAARNLPGAEFLGISELTNEVSVLIPAFSIVAALRISFFDRIEESQRFELENHPAYGAYQALSYNAIQARPLQDATWGGYYWDTTGTNKHKRIAILDTGIWPHHPAFWVSEKPLTVSFGDTLSHVVPISVAAWTSWVHLLPKRSDDLSKLYYMRSSNYGITWDTARVIADAGTGSVIEDFEIGAASDGATQYIVALYLRLWYDANGPRHTVTVVRSANGGTTWSAPLELYTSPSFSTLAGYYLDHIGLAVTRDGGTVWAHAAWDERAFVSPAPGDPWTVTGEVKLRRSNALGANTWMAVQTIFSEVKPPTGGIAPYSYTFDELDGSADGADVHLVFHRVFNDGMGNAEEKLFLYGSGDDGGTWASVYSLVLSTAAPILPAYPSVATKDGVAHVVYGRDSTLRYTRFPSPPGSPVLLTTSMVASPIPDIAVTRDTSTLSTFRRIVHVVWYDARGGVISVRYKRHPNGGDPATAWDDGDTNPANNNEDVSKKISFDYAAGTIWKPTLSLAAIDEATNKLAVVHIAWRDTRSVGSKKHDWYANSTKIVDWRDHTTGLLKPQEFGGNDHGTEVSSVAAGAVVDRTSGTADLNPFMGTAHNAVLAVAAYNTGSFEASVINGIKWAVDTTLADVLNMSLGFPSNAAVADSGSRRVTQYVDWAVGRGIVVTKSAGNRGLLGAGTITPPGDNFNALTVGGSNRPGSAIMPISSLGPVLNGRIKPDIVAPGGDGNSSHHDSGPTGGPGGDIYTGDPDPNSNAVRMYDWWEGTSFAAPHVAGISAMLLQANPTWTPGAVRKALESTAAAVTGAARPNNNEGWGLIQGNAASSFDPSPFPPSILPTAVDFEDSSAQGGVAHLRSLVKPNGGVNTVFADLAAFGVAASLVMADSGTIAGGWHVYTADYTVPAGTPVGMKHVRVTAFRTAAGVHDTVKAYINLYIKTAPVPIQLARFTGTFVSPNHVLLEWTTLSEINNYGFEAQKSNAQNGIYQTIPQSFIPGHGTTLERHNYNYRDTTASSEMRFYRLKQIDLDGSVHYTDAIQIGVTSVKGNNVPSEFALHQNFPNPFNPITLIRFDLPAQSRVTLIVYDVLGREVKKLIDEVRPAGFYTIPFDGGFHASGVYYYRIVAGTFAATRTMVLLK